MPARLSVCCCGVHDVAAVSATNLVTAATIPGRSGHDRSSTARDTCGAYQMGPVGTVCDDGPMMRTALGAALAGVGLLTNDGTDLPGCTARAMIDAFDETGTGSQATTAGTAGG